MVPADRLAKLASQIQADGTLPVSVAPGSGALPSGLIVMWAGLLSAIPTGWKLCDGTLGTPDLRARFVKGSAAGINPGVTGGAATHTHAGHAAHVVTQPGAHTDHVVTQPSAHTNHVVTQPAAHSNHAALATHAHELPFTKLAGATGALRMLAGSIFGTGTSRAPESVSANPTANTTAAAVALSQAVSGGTPDAHSAHAGAAVDAHSAHAGTAVTAHSAHAGTAVDAHSAHDTPNSEPVYYSLAFIQKT